MKSREIIKQLEKLGDVDVKYVYDYGNHWRIVYICDDRIRSVTGQTVSTNTDEFDIAFEGAFDDEAFDHEGKESTAP